MSPSTALLPSFFNPSSTICCILVLKPSLLREFDLSCNFNPGIIVSLLSIGLGLESKADDTSSSNDFTANTSSSKSTFCMYRSKASFSTSIFRSLYSFNLANLHSLIATASCNHHIDIIFTQHTAHQNHYTTKPSIVKYG
ncbi:hypothetical protein V8G54_002457 [Vigna mungo]|uniref:Uncharacterized protein n=1 Tax=Vigna mungo TaxID=3915 RepID=A0AAQ3SBW4_VIGMU